MKEYGNREPETQRACAAIPRDDTSFMNLNPAMG